MRAYLRITSAMRGGLRMDTAREQALVASLAYEIDKFGGATSAQEAALQRGWLSRNGSLTKEGGDIARSLSEQTCTRSVFRNYR